MALRLYEDAALANIVTLENIFTNPDDEADLDGDAGETAQKALFAAMEQTTLSADINNSVTTIPLNAARFADTGLNVIIIGTEKMFITAGHGTTSLTVTRPYQGTSAASHSEDDAVILCYDAAADASVTCTDNAGTDESSWVTYCADSGGNPDENWQSSYAIGALDYNSSALKFWRRVVVPASSDPQLKIDLLHSVSATITEHEI
ncbi:hypothetical protein LCGC14_1420630 [marine sediment metagenome]|uniref:Uncharacterized protein n=1 Tax=marine sediment metagenome TaxID=412755 RepID=A0A0F9MT60_9ZZZZ